MNKAQAIQSFWSAFGIPAYDESTVPDDAQMPYITYGLVTDSIEYTALLTGSVWYRSTSWEAISQKADEISEYIGNGRVIPLDYGYVYLYRGTPFAQRMADETDSMVRRIYFNVSAEYLTDK